MNTKASGLCMILIATSCAGETPRKTPEPAGSCPPGTDRVIVFDQDYAALSGDVVLEIPAIDARVACVGPAVVDALERSGATWEADAVVSLWPEEYVVTPLIEPEEGRQWGMSKVAARAAHGITRGSAVDVAIIDSGVDCDHRDIGGCVAKKDYAGGGALHPHGTHVAGIVAAQENGYGVLGLAPASRIIDQRVLGSGGSGNLSSIALAITEAKGLGAEVINMSLGGPSSSVALQRAIDVAIASGVVVVAASGNAGTSAPSYPGCSDGVIGVGATTENDARASFSNHGSCVDIGAPGTNILSSIPGGFASWNGTSMASPHVAGAAALLLARGAAPASVLERLRAGGDVGPSDLGGKRLNARGALAGLDATPSPATTATATRVLPAPPSPTSSDDGRVCTRTLTVLVKSGGDAWREEALSVLVPCP